MYKLVFVTYESEVAHKDVCLCLHTIYLTYITVMLGRHNLCVLHPSYGLFDIYIYTNSGTDTNSAVNGLMNACMTVQSSPIMFGLNVFETLPKVFWLWFGKRIMH